MRENEEQTGRSAERSGGSRPTEPAATAGEGHARHPVLLLMGVLFWETCKVLVRGVARRALVPFHATPRARTEAKEGERTSDRNLDPERESAPHRRRGTMLILLAYLAAIAGGFGFLYFYWYGGSTPQLGTSLAFFLGGIGCSLVLHARWLMLRREAAELREQLASSPEERESALQSFSEGTDEVGRRGLFVGIALTALGFVAAIVVSLFRSLGPQPSAFLYDTVWKRGQRLMKSDGTPVQVDALQPGTTMIVFPEKSIGDERAQTVLVRVDEHYLDLPQGRKDWAPDGYVAYSRVCTHAGCPVGMYESTTDLLMCPCHQSTFDVLRGARPTGGPAARALPQLPLYVDAAGILRAGGGFSEPPGPGFWQLR